MKAVVLQGGTSVKIVSDRDLPRLRPGYLLVKVVAVALNPVDWKTVDEDNKAGALLGYDYAGVVAEIGEGYQKEWKVGDRISGLSNGGNVLEPEDGAFAEYITVKADIQMRIPDNVSFEDAATLGVGVITCGQGLFQAQGLGLRMPGESGKAEALLIYGGSTATGSLGIQFAKMAGYTVLTTCSPRNFDFVKSLGADHVFDYRDPKCAEEIRKVAQDNLMLVWDCISLEASAKICAAAIKTGGKYRSLLGYPLGRDDVSDGWTVGNTAFGEAVLKEFEDFKSDGSEEDFTFASKWTTVVEQLVADGKLKFHPPKVTSGLEGVLNGLELLKADKVSGQKLVYTL